MESQYVKERRMIALGLKKPPEKKKAQPIASKSAKTIAKEKKDRKENGPDEDTQKEKWFKARRSEMIGICQCGCAEESSKKDDMYFRHSIAHIFPKAKFESVALHRLNWVERAFFGGCHSVMDDTSMDKWPNMADWEDIKMKFHELAPLLTDEERAAKFYTKLESLIYKN